MIPNNRAKSESPQRVKRFHGMQFQLHFSFVALFVAILISLQFCIIKGVPFTSFPGMEKAERQHAIRDLALFADLEKRRLLELLSTLHRDAEAIAQDSLMIEGILELTRAVKVLKTKESSISELIQETGKLKATKTINDVISQIWKRSGHYKKLTIIDSEGTVIFSTSPTEVGSDHSQEMSFLGALNTGNFYLCGAIQHKPSGKVYFQVSHVIEDSENDIIGVMVLDESSEKAFEHLFEGMGETGETILVGKDATILTPLKYPLADGSVAKPMEYQITAKPAVLAASGFEGVIRTQDYRGESVIAAYRHIRITPDWGWGMVVKINEQELYETINIYTTVIMWAGVVAVLLVVLLTFILASCFTAPLLYLVSITRELSSGDHQIRSRLKRKDEIGLLSDSLNLMAEQIESSYDELETLVHERTSELKQEKEKAQKYLDIAGAILLSIDRDGTVTLINQRGCATLGFNEADIVGKNWFEHFLPEPGRNELRTLFKEIMQGKFDVLEDFEYDIQTKVGKKRTILWKHSLIYNDKGEITHLFSSGEDVTERKIALQRLKSSESKYRGMIDHLVVAFYATTPDGKKLLKHNAEFLRILGYEGIWQKTPTTPDMNPEQRVDYLDALLRQGVVNNYEIDVKKVDGDLIRLQLNARLIMSKSGTPKRIEGTFFDITEEQRKSRELIESEKKYRSLFEQMLNGFSYCRIIVDENNDPVDFVYLAVNNAFERLTGLSRKNIVGEKVTEVFPGIRELLPILFETYGAVALNGIDAKFEIFFEPIKKWLSISAYSPEKGYFVAMFDDITLRKTAETLLQESEQRLRTLLENINLIAIGLDLEGNVTYANPRFLQLCDVKKKDVLGKNWFTTFIPEGKRDDFSRIHKEVITSEKHQYYENPILLPNGATRLISWNNTRIHDIDGNVAGTMSIGDDITERRKTEDSLRQLKNAIEQAGEMIIITNNKGIIEYANPAVFKTTGYSPEELLGKTPRIFYSGKQEGDFYRNLWKAIKAGEIWTGSLKNKKKSGDIYEEEMTISPVFNEEKRITHFVAIKRDITQDKKLRDQLIFTEKLSTVGTFVAGVAHELNNPLTSVIGFAELLLEDETLPEKAKDKIRTIYEQSERTVDIVRNLLMFSRKGKKESSTVDINDMIGRIIKLHSYRLRSDNVQVDFEPPKKLALVEGVESELQQVFMNIIVNAHQAMLKQKKGILTIRVEVQKKFVSITIENNGPPIPSSQFKQLFDPFFTTKEPGEGTGLGLYISHQIVKGHNGEISAKNVPGGVRFTVQLPLTGRAKPSSPVEKTENIQGANLKILIIDDEASVREYVATLLTKANNFCIDVDNALEAMKLVEGSSFDVIISDVKMPEMSGLDFGRWLSEEKPEMMDRFVLLTGLIDEETEQFTKEYKCHLLRKPVSKKDVFTLLTSLNRRKDETND